MIQSLIQLIWMRQLQLDDFKTRQSGAGPATLETLTNVAKKASSTNVWTTSRSARSRSANATVEWNPSRLAANGDERASTTRNKTSSTRSQTSISADPRNGIWDEVEKDRRFADNAATTINFAGWIGLRETRAKDQSTRRSGDATSSSQTLRSTHQFVQFLQLNRK